MTTDVPVLEIDGLTVDIAIDDDRRVPVIADVALSVGAGEILGIVGESGSGKSMTAMSIMRMLPGAASVRHGSVRYAGRDLLAMSESEMTALRGEEIGMIFQDPLAFLNPLMTVGQQIAEVLVLHGTDRRRARARALELLRLVGVRDPESRIDDYPHQFSGGMRQRVIIAIAVANNPALLIADEPPTALDVTVQAEILQLLTRLRDDLGAGLVLITHDIGIVEEVCDSVAVMYAGRIVEHGRTADVLRQPRHPYTRALMRSTPRLGLADRRRLPAIPGQPPDLARRPAGCAFHPRCPLASEQCTAEEPPLIRLHDAEAHRVACWAAGETEPPAAVEVAAPPPVRETDPSPILEVRDLRVGYQRRSLLRRGGPRDYAVDGVDLHVRRGRALGLVGESGCGKSTLARTVVGLLTPSSGEVRVAGGSWTGGRRERAALRRTVQMVFQDPYSSLNPRQTIGTILTEPLIVHGLHRDDRPGRVEELLGLVGLSTSLLDRYPYQLSGGQRQRVGIARALTLEPELIVADEPVSALDVSVQAQVINLLADLRDKLGLGILFIAHDLSVVRHLCDEVAVMQRGHIVEYADTASVFESPQHPYTRSLLAAAPGARTVKEQL
jgi:peptide/nickel transport system ATP-binding protein